MIDEQWLAPNIILGFIAPLCLIGVTLKYIFGTSWALVGICVSFDAWWRGRNSPNEFSFGSSDLIIMGTILFSSLIGAPKRIDSKYFILSNFLLLLICFANIWRPTLLSLCFFSICFLSSIVSISLHTVPDDPKLILLRKIMCLLSVVFLFFVFLTLQAEREVTFWARATFLKLTPLASVLVVAGALIPFLRLKLSRSTAFKDRFYYYMVLLSLLISAWEIGPLGSSQKYLGFSFGIIAAAGGYFSLHWLSKRFPIVLSNNMLASWTICLLILAEKIGFLL